MSSSKKIFLKEYIEDNEVLIEKLKDNQYLLEKYFNLEFQNIDAVKEQLLISQALLMNTPDNLVIDVISKNIKLEKIINIQKKINKIEKENSIFARIGNFIANDHSTASLFINTPIKLFKIWRTYQYAIPPKQFGKNFSEIITRYNDAGEEAVEKLLNSVPISPTMRADAYTMLARYLKQSTPQKAAQYAKLAYNIDPKDYRLKWLAFRLYEASDAVTADAILTILPNNISMSDWEKQQLEKIKKDSHTKLMIEAQKYLPDDNQKKLYSGFLNEIKTRKNGNDEKTKKLTEKIGNLNNEISKFSKENNELHEKNKKLTKKIDNLNNEVNKFSKENNELQEKNKKLIEKIDDINNEIAKLNKLNNNLQEKNENMSIKNEDLSNEIDELKLKFDKLTCCHDAINKENKILKEYNFKIQKIAIQYKNDADNIAIQSANIYKNILNQLKDSPNLPTIFRSMLGIPTIDQSNIFNASPITEKEEGTIPR